MATKPPKKALNKYGLNAEERAVAREGAKYGLYGSTALGVGKLVEQKQAAYGDSFGKSGAVMRILYPKGVSLEQLDDALTVVRILDKLFRVATARDALGESPWQDVMGYALLATVRVRRLRFTARAKLHE